jgi:hypothetical protein
MGAGGGRNGTGGGNAMGGSTGSVDCSTLKLCDDFESGMLATSTWRVSQGGGYTATVGTDQAHSGTHSVHVVAPVAAGSAFITETKTFPAADFWGRAWLRFKGVAGSGHQMNIYVAAPGDQLRLLNRNGGEAIRINFQKTDTFYNSKTTVPQEMWFCYEWHVSATATHVYFALEGKDSVELTDVGTVPGVTGGTSLSLGYQRFQPGTAGAAATDLWIDDVAVDAARIGCN